MGEKLEITGVVISNFFSIQAPNREALLADIDDFIIAHSSSVNTEAPYLRLEILCRDCIGGVVEYKTKADVPEESVSCPCGNPKHWLIKYSEER